MRSPSVRRTVRVIEWIVIGLYTVAVAFGSRHHATFLPVLLKLAYLLGMFGLSWLFPIDRSLWQKGLYLLVGIAATFAIYPVGFIPDLSIYLYILKARLFLKLKTAILVAVVADIVNLILVIRLIPLWNQINQNCSYNPADPWVLVDIGINSIVVFTSASSFTIVLGSMVMAEQHSRHRAEALTQEIEYLAAKLERTRIARDIHDSLGHTITDLDIHLSVAQKFRKLNPEQMVRALDTAKLLSSQCIEEISRSIQTIRNSNFDLSQALTALINQINRTTTLKVTAEIDLQQLSIQKSHHIYCIFKEGLMNIQKHARATQVYLQCRSTEEGVWLELRDDGCGFNPASPSAGFGLQGMQERVKLLRGTLEIYSNPGSGTHIQALIPQ